MEIFVSSSRPGERRPVGVPFGTGWITAAAGGWVGGWVSAGVLKLYCMKTQSSPEARDACISPELPPSNQPCASVAEEGLELAIAVTPSRGCLGAQDAMEPLGHLASQTLSRLKRIECNSRRVSAETIDRTVGRAEVC